MGFSNPILAGEALVRTAVQSPNYEPGLTGWSINQDGSAEFDDVDIRGTISATASRALTADTADFATAAESANTANSATTADSATTAESANTANSATTAGTAANADNADAVNGPVTSTDMNAQSANYVPGGAEDPGLGWMIDSAGNAEFNNITARGDMEGSVGAFDNLIANNSFNYLGNELDTVLAGKGGGIIAYHGRTSSSVTAAHNTEVAFMRLNATLEPGQFYDIRLASSFYTNGGARAVADIYIRHTTNGTNPTFASTLLHGIAIEVPGGGIPIAIEINRPYHNGTAFPIQLKMLFSFKPVISGQTGNLYATSTWPSTWSVAQHTNAIPFTGADDNGAGTPPTVFRSFDIQPYASRSYKGDGTLYTPGSGDIQQYCMQGDVGLDGNRRSWMWFDANSTAGGNGLGSLNDMQGAASFDYFDVFLYYPHWYFSTGGTAFIGHHNSNLVTNAEQGGGSYGGKQENWPGRNIGKWVSLLGTNIATAAAAGTIEGLILGNTGSATLNHYGYAFGASQAPGFKPGLRAGYYK